MKKNAYIDSKNSYYHVSYAFLVAAFCGLLLISNIVAVKPISLGFFVADGGLFIFPLVYVIGDILSEVYGWLALRRAVIFTFVMSILASLIIILVGVVPAIPNWDFSDDYNNVLGFVPRIVIASLAGFLCGQLLNGWILIKIKQKWGPSRLWVRLLGSSIVGQIVDTTIFCVIAFIGVMSASQLLNYIVVGVFLKFMVEVICVPVTYIVVRYIKAYV